MSDMNSSAMERSGSGSPSQGKHIALLLGALPLGSRERMIVSVAQALLDQGHRVDFIVPGKSAAWREAVPAGARLLELGSRWLDNSFVRINNKRRLLLVVPLLAAYLRRQCPDVLFTMSIPPNLTGLAAARLAGSDVPVIVRQSNVVSMPDQADYQQVRTRWRDRLIPRLYPRAAAVIAVSHGVADNVAKLMPIPKQRIHVVYNQIVTPDMAERATQPVPCAWLNLREKPVILAVGRLVPKKDYPTLLRAFARLRKHLDARLVILGEGPRRGEIEQLVSELELTRVVALPGRVDNPFAYMARASLLVLSSISEGMPSVLIEALACGCPVVSTDCPAGPAEILEQGRYGALVPVGDIQALASEMQATLESPPDPALLKQRANTFAVGGAVDSYIEVLLAHVR